MQLVARLTEADEHCTAIMVVAFNTDTKNGVAAREVVRKWSGLWLNLQKRYDLRRAEWALGEKINAIPTLDVA